MYTTLKLFHVGAAILTISGFCLRGYWMFADSPTLQLKVVKVLPHIVDTIFLASGIALIVTLKLPVLTQIWLLTKFAALSVYVVLGAIALGRGRTLRARTAAFVLALVTFAYTAGVASSKSTLSWFALIVQ